MKKTLYIFLIIIVSILLLLFGVVSALHSSKVQTIVTDLVVHGLGDKMGTYLDVGSVEFKFFNRLVIKDIYIEDQQKDTLLYVKSIEAQLDLFNLQEKQLAFSKVEVDTVLFNAYRLSDTTYNYSFITSLFQHSDGQVDIPTFSVNKVLFTGLRARYDDYILQQGNIALTIPYLNKDSLCTQLTTLQLTLEKQHHPLIVKSGGLKIRTNWEHFYLTKMALVLPHSHMKVSKIQAFLPKDTLTGERRFKDFEGTVKGTDIEVCPNDLALFVPILERIHSHVQVKNGSVWGNGDTAVVQDLQLVYENQTILRTDVAIGRPFDKKNITLYVLCQNLFADPTILQDILANIKGEPVVLNERVQALGAIYYRGRMIVQPTKATLYGLWHTNIGILTTKLSAQRDKTGVILGGRVATRNVELSGVTGIKDMHEASFVTMANVHIDTAKHIKGDADFHLRRLNYKDYLYTDAHIRGSMDGKLYQGTINYSDTNADVFVRALVDMRRDFMVKSLIEVPKCNLQAMNLVSNPKGLYTTFNGVVDFKAKSVDEVVGQTTFSKIVLGNSEEEVRMKFFDVQVNNNHNTHSLQIQSDLIKGSVTGEFQIVTLPITFQKLAYKYVPSIFPNEKKDFLAEHPTKNQVNMDIYCNDLDKVTHIFTDKFAVVGLQKIHGVVDEVQGEYLLDFYSTQLRWKSLQLQDLLLSTKHDIQSDVFLTAQLFRPAQDSTSKDLDLKVDMAVRTVTDSMQLRMGFIDNAPSDTIHNRGTMEIHADVARVNDCPVINVQFLPNRLVVADTFVDINASHMTFVAEEKMLRIDSFSITHKDQLLALNGILSRRPEDHLVVQMSKLDVSPLLPTLLDRPVVTLAGRLSGKAVMQNLFESPYITSTVLLEDATLNGDNLGDSHASLEVNIGEKRMDFVGDVIKYGHKNSDVVGHVDFTKRYWHLNIDCDSISMAFINYWSHGIIDDISGTTSGKVQVYGTSSNHKVWVEAAVIGNETAMTIPFTGARYYISDSMFMTPNSIDFRDMHLHDYRGHEIVMNGKIGHQNFKHFTFDFGGQFKDMLVMDLPYDPERVFSGQVFGDGGIYIKGDQKRMDIDAEAATTSNSVMHFNVATASTADDNDFVQFVKFDSLKAQKLRFLQRPIGGEESSTAPVVTTHRDTSMEVVLNIRAEATPLLKAQLTLDQKNGDRLEGVGNGDLNFIYASKSKEMKMLGTYTLQSGKFNFTLGNIIHKDFDILSGSSVTWNGEVASPTVDIKAKYKVTASLRDLFGNDASSLHTNRSSVPVNCIIGLTDQLQNPLLHFDIELPNSDETVQDQVKGLINTDEMLMQQVVYLLVFNRFFTPDYLRSTTAGANETYSFLSSTVTGQINSWLGKLTDRVALGFNFRADGEGATASQEYETSVQLNPVNRLLINGNFGYRYNDLSNRPFFGDVDVEFMLTPEGQLRLRGYSHSVDKYSLKQANMVEGLGFTYNYDYNRGDTRKRLDRKKELRAEKKVTKKQK